MSLDDLEEKLSRNAETIFWVLYLLVPTITGLLAYNWLPNEVYNPERHQLIASHDLVHSHTKIHLDLWYAFLFGVVEGWRREKIPDQEVTALLRDTKKLALLEGYRNAVVHYGPSYIESRQVELFKSPDFVGWVW